MVDIQEYANRVYKSLGPGFNECVYHNAMEVLLRKNNISYETERIVPILFEGHTIGNLRADIIIDGQIVVELKAVKALTDTMTCQAKNYLKLLHLRQAYLVNFPQQSLPLGADLEAEVKHIVLEQEEGEAVSIGSVICDNNLRDPSSLQ
jgi:GxxExxY protein